MLERCEHKHLAISSVNRIEQRVDTLIIVQRYGGAIGRVDPASRYLQQLHHYCASIGCGDLLRLDCSVCVIDQRLVDLRLLRPKLHIDEALNTFGQLDNVIERIANSGLHSSERLLHCVGFGNPLELRQAVHQLFAEPSEILRHGVRRDDSALRPRIGRLVGDGRSGHAPDPRHTLRQLACDLCALRPTVTIDRKLVEHHRIDILASGDVVYQHFETIVVDDEDLSVRIVERFEALVARPM